MLFTPFFIIGALIGVNEYVFGLIVVLLVMLFGIFIAALIVGNHSDDIVDTTFVGSRHTYKVL